MKRVGDLLLLLTLVGVALSDQSESIIELTDKNIGSLLNQSIHAVVEFYAPWCGYCQEFAPIYEEAAKRIRKMNDTILVAKINADQFEEAAEQYDIEGLPTIKWFANGVDKYEYAGQPSIENFMSWVIKVSTTPASELITEEDVVKSSNDKLSVTAVFDEYHGGTHDAFMDIALLSDDIVFYKTLNKTLLQVEHAPSLIFRKNLSGHPIEVIRKPLLGVNDPGEEIYSFLDKHRYPDFYIFDSSEVEKMMASLENVDREYHVHIVVPENMLKDKLLLEAAREAGREIRDKAILVISSKHAKSPLHSAFNILSTDYIQTFAAHTQSIRKYALESSKKESFEAGDIINFTKAVESGDNKYRVYASASLPEKSKENGVEILVRSNLEQVTGDVTKDVVVLSYHPDSDESLESEATFENLAKAFTNISSILLAKFDVSVNEHELVDYPMEELPKVTIFKASKDSDPITMDASEEVDVESVGNFIHKNAGIKFELPDLSEYISHDWETWNEEADDDDETYEEEDQTAAGSVEHQDENNVVHEEL